MRIFLAGTESSVMRPPVAGRLVSNGFTTFYYLRKKPDGGRDILMFLRGHIPMIVVDSGAHSFFAQSEHVPSAAVLRTKHKSKTGPHTYFAEYLEWADANRDLFDYFVELDIGELVGQETVYRWRKMIEARGLSHKLITCYHPTTETKEQFVSSLKDVPSRYVGLEGFPGGHARYDHMPIIRACYEAGVRVHGFAMTKMVVFESMPFYSVDSTSFLSPLKYGTAYVVKDERDIGQTVFMRPRDAEHRDQMARLAINNRLPLSYIQTLRGANRKKDTEHIGVLTAARNCRVLQNRVTRLWKARGVDWESLFGESHLEQE